MISSLKQLSWNWPPNRRQRRHLSLQLPGYDMFLEMMTQMRRNVIYSMFMFQPRMDSEPEAAVLS